VRIIAGSRKGHRIAAPKGLMTRPTGDRVREAAFNLIGLVDDADVLDLFAGSGAMGLEALSRGARSCVFVENAGEAARAIDLNLARLRLTGALVVQRDVMEVLREEIAAGHRYDLVLADPPYDGWPELQPKLAERLPAVVEPDGLVVVETQAGIEPDLPLDLVTSRRYGSARITLFRPHES
jgi:16S rRNA (guanine966-N2)-methyltransferase